MNRTQPAPLPLDEPPVVVVGPTPWWKMFTAFLAAGLIAGYLTALLVGQKVKTALGESEVHLLAIELELKHPTRR